MPRTANSPKPKRLPRVTTLSWGVQGDLPDLNVWLALAVQEHPLHAAAHRYWEALQTPLPASTGVVPFKLYFCRQTAMGLVHLLCQPGVVGKGSLTLDAAWALYQRIRALPNTGMLAEPLGCEAALGTFLANQSGASVSLWPSMNLAALAQSSGLRLVSFDYDLQRMGVTNFLLLRAEATDTAA
jgi:uncharacterized protein